MDRPLPVFKIEGTDFFVDVNNMALREKDNPGNIILIADMDDSAGQGYRFDYDRKEKNIPGRFSRYSDMIQVQLPDLVMLDPEGMAEKFKIPVGDLKKKTDFDLMVDMEALRERLAGIPPMLGIAGQDYQVDIQMDVLRPRDNPALPEIRFPEIQKFYYEGDKAYFIPYSKSRHVLEEPDYEKITRLPRHISCMRFPHESILDPIGWNRKNGRGMFQGIKQKGIRRHYTAVIVPWQKTALNDVVYANLNRQLQQKRGPHL